MSRSLAYFYLALGTAALWTLVLSSSQGLQLLGLAVIAALSSAVSITLFACARNAPAGVLQLGVALASALATAVCALAVNPLGPYPVLYAGLCWYASYFFTRAQAACHIAWVAVLYAAVVASQQAAGRAVWLWLIVVCGLGAASAVVLIVRDRTEGLVAQLLEAARTDPLTGLLNRRGFEELFDIELERAERSQTSLSIVMVDLDHFKRVNDRLGHSAGDRALQRLALTLDRSKRRIDTAARLGGEEFALLLPDTGDRGAHTLAERMRAAVKLAFAADRLELTVSLGVATFPLDGRRASELLGAVDRALYQAKAQGRDRTVVYEALDHTSEDQQFRPYHSRTR